MLVVADAFQITQIIRNVRDAKSFLLVIKDHKEEIEVSSKHWGP
jgi:hypothetical protein